MNKITVVEFAPDDEQVAMLYGGDRKWRDVHDNTIIDFTTLYVPFRCIWGTNKKTGQRNELCTFCALPNAVIEYEHGFYDGKIVPFSDQVGMFAINLRKALLKKPHLHTLGIFNAASYFEMGSDLEIALIEKIVQIAPSIKRLVIESRAELITEEKVIPIVERLNKVEINLTIRVGVETQHDTLREKVLKKGHPRVHLFRARDVMKRHNVAGGGYALLKPAPRYMMAPAIGDNSLSEDDVNQWAVQETKDTIEFILGNGDNQLGWDEVYYCATNVGPGTPLEKEWRQGNFEVASLWMVYDVLRSTKQYGRKIQLLPFKDTPPFLAVSSNHNPKGLPESLEGATDCDLLFHAALNNYRETLDMEALVAAIDAADCCKSCKPSWIE